MDKLIGSLFISKYFSYFFNSLLKFDELFSKENVTFEKSVEKINVKSKTNEKNLVYLLFKFL